MAKTPSSRDALRDSGPLPAAPGTSAPSPPSGSSPAGSGSSAGGSSGPLCPHCGEDHPTTYSHCPRTGRPLQTGPALIGRIIAGRYRVTGILGEGGMGAVYIAEHLLLGRKVALKRLHPELTADVKAVARFQREARAAAATGHEHIVEVLDLGYAEDGAPFLVMEYLRGTPLSQVLKADGRLPPARACDIVGQVLAALAAVHKLEIVHRDLKPDNVFLTRRGGVSDYVKVLDFGISKMKQEDGEPNDLTRTGVTMGTPIYMSPEQARGMRKLDHRVDLYAAAVILYECITGRIPYSGDNYHALLQQILRFEPPVPSTLVAGVPKELDAILQKGLAKDPAQRFASAEAFLEALVPFGAKLEALATEPPASATIPVAPPSPGGLTNAVTNAIAVSPAMSMTGANAGNNAGATSGIVPAPSMTSGSAEERSDARLRALNALALLEPERARPLPPRPAPRPTPASTTAGQPLPLPSLTGNIASLGSTSSSLGALGTLGSGSSAGGGSGSSGGGSAFPAATAAASGVVIPPVGRPPIPTRTAARTTTETGPRYFFAASEDWTGPIRSGLGPTSAAAPTTPSGPFTSPLLQSTGAFGSNPLGIERPSDRSFERPLDRPPSASIDRPSGRSRELDDVREPTPSRLVREDHAVKGSLVLGLLDHYEGELGVSGFQEIVKDLDATIRAKLDGVILPMAWLPFSTFDALLNTAERVGPGDGGRSMHAGRALAERELSTTHRLFLQTASPPSLLDRIPHFHRIYFTRGDVRLVGSAVGTRLEIEGAPPESMAFVSWLSGFWLRMLELSGAREARIVGMSCRSRGDEKTSVTLRWR